MTVVRYFAWLLVVHLLSAGRVSRCVDPNDDAAVYEIDSSGGERCWSLRSYWLPNSSCKRATEIFALRHGVLSLDNDADRSNIR
ncbi:hypothetical protein ACSSV1_006214 [Labrenzia sp. MBR-25]|jgi:hypothetical protein